MVHGKTFGQWSVGCWEHYIWHSPVIQASERKGQGGWGLNPIDGTKIPINSDLSIYTRCRESEYGLQSM